MLRRACDEIGRDVATIARSLYLHAYFSDDPTEHAQRQHALGEIVLLGPTPADAIAQLQPFAALGVSHVAVKPHTLATVEGLVAEVAPALAKA
jgi:hypothetical protein